MFKGSWCAVSDVSPQNGDSLPDANGEVELVLDLSRLISRALHATPTGVDRVELAYARELQRRMPDRLAYGAVHPTGIYGRLPARRAERFLDGVERLWMAGARSTSRAARWTALLRSMAAVRPAPVPPKRGRRVVLQSSPHHLDRERAVRAILRREEAAFVCLLHDLIPIRFPEYARPGGAERHRRRIRTIAALADGMIANSHDTARAFGPYLAEAGRDVRVAVAHLGLDAIATAPGMPDPAPYFVAIGTIEPRKNHLLLLHLWRDLAERLPATEVPRLVLIGRRGWENEQVLDLLDRCPALAGHGEEQAGLADPAVRSLLRGARALLLPSFAEGFGMPVPEALALGVPVLCSDLPALREAGGDAPLYLDPLDGPAWRRAVLALADAGGAAREEHLARVRRWRAPTWDDHLSIVLDLALRVAR